MHLKYGVDVPTEILKKLEKLQLAAAKIVTGLTLLGSRETIYFETGWGPLIDRRKAKNKKERIMYKIYHNMVLDYLHNIIPKIRSMNQCM